MVRAGRAAAATAACCVPKGSPKPGRPTRCLGRDKCARIGAPLNILKTQPIRRQVIAGLAIALLPLAASLIWSGARALEERENEVRGEAKSVAATSASYLNQYLDGLDSLASALVRNPSVRALRPEECDALFAAVLKERSEERRVGKECRSRWSPYH